MPEIGFKDLNKAVSQSKPPKGGVGGFMTGLNDSGLLDKAVKIIEGVNKLMEVGSKTIAGLGNLKDNPQLASLLGQRHAQLGRTGMQTFQNARTAAQQPQNIPQQTHVLPAGQPSAALPPLTSNSVSPGDNAENQFEQIMKGLKAVKVALGDVPISKVMEEATKNKKAVIKLLGSQ